MGIGGLISKLGFGRVAGAAAIGAALAFAPMTASAQSGIRDAEIEAILHEWFNPLLIAGGLQPADVDIILINDKSINAFVANGQKIHIHTGLIIETQTPEQLKGVIAHEMGHIIGAHLARGEDAIRASGGMSLISIGLGVLAIAAGAPDAGVALLGSAQQFQAMSVFKYLRNEESEADQYGVQLMEKTHQSATGLLYFLEKFRYEELMSSTKQDPYFRTHPVSNQRIQAIRERVAEVEKTAQPQSDRAREQLAVMKAKLIGFIESPMIVAKKYPKTDTSAPARYARAISEYRAVDIKAAMADIDSLLADDPKNPYYWELKGQILFENGKVDESIEPNRKSVEYGPKEALLKVNLARSLIESKGNYIVGEGKPTERADNLKEAETVLMDSLQQEKDNPFAWNQLANCYGKQHRDAEAALATAEERYFIGDRRTAYNFARRAMDKLDRNSPKWQRADDIIRVTDPRLGRRG